MTPSDFVGVEAEVTRRGLSLGRPLVVLAVATSTNDLAKAAAKDGAPHGSVWIAETQSHGRGRQGRAWTSPPGENLLVSILLRTPCPPSRLPLLSLVAGLAVRDAVALALGDEGSDRVRVKWPNDVLVRDAGGGSQKKIAGILVESTLAGSLVEAIVVGIGVNVHTRVLPEELASRATSLVLAGAAAPSRADVLVAILGALDRDVPRVAAKGLAHVHDRLVRACALSGKTVTAGDVTGTCEGIDLEGRLTLRDARGELVRVSSGEAHLGHVG